MVAVGDANHDELGLRRDLADELVEFHVRDVGHAVLAALAREGLGGICAGGVIMKISHKRVMHIGLLIVQLHS